MTARLSALLPRLAALTVIGLLAASSITFAAARKTVEKADTNAPVQAGPKVVRVPDVEGQAYVFAKGILEDAGFAWRVVGSVRGYAANTVASQSPAPGTKVLDTGTPTIVLRLKRNPAYAQRGLPQDVSTYPGTRLRLAHAPRASAGDGAAKNHESSGDASTQAPDTTTSTAPTTTAPTTTASTTTSSTTTAPTTTAPTTTGSGGDAAPTGDGSAGAGASATPRTPDFVVPGAPKEPTDEMPLPDRARLVQRRIDAAAKPNPKLVGWWLYQQSWIVSGAKFGWHDGAAALRILVRVDDSMQARWGFGAKSAAEASAALAEVERRASK